MLEVSDAVFTTIPLRWVMDLKAEDLKKMILLRWRFSGFAELAQQEGRSVSECMYESQESLCHLFGMSISSRTKVGKFLTDMESRGYIAIRRTKVEVDGKVRPRHFIVVMDPYLIERYNLKEIDK